MSDTEMKTHTHDKPSAKHNGAEVNVLTPVGAELLTTIERFFARYVRYPSLHHLRAHVLWCAHTHLMDCWESTPRIHFCSPEPGSGKTRALEVSEHVVRNGFVALNMSTAYLIRKLGTDDLTRPTLLYDEIDTVFGPKASEHEDIRGIINSGHRRGAVSGRCEARGVKVKTVDFPSYGAVALAGLHGLPDTITSRAVVVPMKKRAKGERVEPWRLRTCEPQAKKLGQQLAAWADTVRERARDYFPEMPEGVEDRDADVWEALISVADMAGGSWPEYARAAAQFIVRESREAGNDSQGVLLLTDLKRVFDAVHDAGTTTLRLRGANSTATAKSGRQAIRTQTLLATLIAIEESPWKSVGRSREPIDARGLSTRLRSYDIRPKDIRWSDNTVAKGYYRDELEDAWKRYVPASVAAETEAATTVTRIDGGATVTTIPHARQAAVADA